MKRLLICILALLMMLPLASCTTDDEPPSNTSESTASTEGVGTTGNNEEESPQDPSKVLDLYLVAGQSNAAGSTKISSTAEIFEFAPELKYGFSKVLYSGTIPTPGAPRVINWKKTTYGLGRTSEHMGPEAGMAKAFSAYYNKETGRTAGIVKYALGGTSIRNWSSANWVPPSYQSQLPASSVTEATGALYRGFLEQVEKSVSDAAKLGYTSVRICGLYWMQGCADRAEPNLYQEIFFCFVRDVRKDVSKIMKRYTNSDDDCGASDMPIIVGTISQTYDLSSATAEQTNIKFIAMQKRFEDIIRNCYVVDNSGYKVSEWKNGQIVVLGSDKYHWKQADALEIGENVGKAMLYCAGVTTEDPFPNRAN